MSSPISRDSGAVDASQFTTIQKEVLEDTIQTNAQQIESKESLESDKSDEAEMQATLKKAETIKKGPQKTEKAQRLGLSAIARQDSDELANNFAKKNKEYHLSEELLKKLADNFDEFFNNSSLFEHELRENNTPEQEITKLLNQKIIEFVTGRSFPATTETPPESIVQTAQNNKTFEFVTFLTDHRLTSMKQSTEKVPEANIKALENFKPKILAAKDAYYGVNQSKIDDFQNKFIALGNVLVEDLEPGAAKEVFGEKVDQLNQYMHNPPDFQSFFSSFLRGGEIAVDLDKLLDTTHDLLEKIGPNLKKANLEPGEIHNLIKAVRAAQSANNAARIAEKQLEQMDRMGVDIPPHIDGGVLAALFFHLTTESRPSPHSVRQLLDKVFIGH